MSEPRDYLDDPSAPPEPRVAELERALGSLKHRTPLDELAAAAAFAARARTRRRRLVRTVIPVLAAAAVLVVVVSLLALRRRGAGPGAPGQPAAGWAVTPLAGTPRAGQRTLAGGAGRLAVGEWLVTDERSRARLAVAEIGQLEVDPRTRLRLVGSTPEQHRLELERGKISAVVDAPPRLFVVDTPAAVATDLGCAYTLEVDESGSGGLHVTSGWVELGASRATPDADARTGGQGREQRLSLVPAGAQCRLTPAGPATPRFEDASPAFAEALIRVDDAGRAGDAGALGTLLGEARLRDSLTLWHLLMRVDADQRARVLDRMLELGASLPFGTSREAVLASDPDAVDLLRDELIRVWFPDDPQVLENDRDPSPDDGTKGPPPPG